MRELLITIMSSLAQEESRSISENVTWGHRRRFADGKVSFAYSRFLGYDKAPDGSLVINEEQAETVRLIYRLFLEGYTPYSIAKELTKRKLLTPGGITRWSSTTVRSILTNVSITTLIRQVRIGKHDMRRFTVKMLVFTTNSISREYSAEKRNSPTAPKSRGGCIPFDDYSAIVKRYIGVLSQNLSFQPHLHRPNLGGNQERR